VGVPRSMNAAGLRPVVRCEIMSVTRQVTLSNTTGILSSTNVADPTGNATNACAVSSWNTRFFGFQQYRIRSTRWIIVPVRTNVGTTTSSQCPGHVGIWVEDSPQTGSPLTAQFLQANRRMMLCNTEKIESIEYATNEPQDLDLSDIAVAPTHTTGSVLQQGQHCLQIYGDNTYTGISGFPASGYTVLYTVTCVYDIEFFGIGGV